MSRLIHCLPALLLCVPAGCGKLDFSEFPIEDGGFTILLPGKPERKEIPSGDSMAMAYEVAFRNGFFAVGFMDIPAGRSFTLEDEVQHIADGHGGVILEQEPFTLEGGTGIEFQIASASPKGYVSGRVLLIGGRSYQLLAGGKDATLSNPDVRQFLNSFALMPDAVIPGAGQNQQVEWKSFTPQEGGWSVMMPGKPMRTVGFNGLAGVRGEVYTARGPAALFRLSVATVPAGKALSPDSAWQQILEEETKQVGLLSQTNLTPEGGSGKEFEISSRDKCSARTLSGRVYLSGGRVFLLLVSGEKARLPNPDVRKFLDSFTLAPVVRKR